MPGFPKALFSGTIFAFQGGNQPEIILDDPVPGTREAILSSVISGSRMRAAEPSPDGKNRKNAFKFEVVSRKKMRCPLLA